MKKLLYIDACIRDEQSRTKRIAAPIIEALRQKYEVQTLVINDLDLSIVKKELVTKRTNGDVEAQMLCCAFLPTITNAHSRVFLRAIPRLLLLQNCP